MDRAPAGLHHLSHLILRVDPGEVTDQRYADRVAYDDLLRLGHGSVRHRARDRLQFAIDNVVTAGIWGGLTPLERRHSLLPQARVG